eukprot:11912586-Prorocentrum_lima.AAC.1
MSLLPLKIIIGEIPGCMPRLAVTPYKQDNRVGQRATESPPSRNRQYIYGCATCCHWVSASNYRVQLH